MEKARIEYLGDGFAIAVPGGGLAAGAKQLAREVVADLLAAAKTLLEECHAG